LKQKFRICIYDNNKNVEDAIYSKVSESVHFNSGETFPLKVVRFQNNCDTLVMLSFLDHYKIPFSLEKSAKTFLLVDNTTNQNLDLKQVEKCNNDAVNNTIN
jgi:hypothetical protein